MRELQEVAAQVRSLVGRRVQLVQVYEVQELLRGQLICLKVDNTFVEKLQSNAAIDQLHTFAPHQISTITHDFHKILQNFNAKFIAYEF